MTGSLLLTPPVARPAHLWYHPLRKETGKVVGYHGNESKPKGTILPHAGPGTRLAVWGLSRALPAVPGGV